MNEDKWLFTTDKLMPIEEIISDIEKYGYIDAHLGYEDEFLVDSILCFLKENKQLKKDYKVLRILHSTGLNELNELQQENQQLKIQVSSREEVANKYKEVIKKAIEYLETATIDPQSMLHYRNCLLEILKGESNE